MKKIKKALALGLSLVTALTLFTGCNDETDSGTTNTVPTVSDDTIFLNFNGTEVPYSVAKFYAHNEQASYESYYLANGYVIDWDSEYEPTSEDENVPEGATIEQLVKEDVLARIKMFYAVSAYAKENGVTLTDEEYTQINSYITEYLAGNQKVVAATGATEEKLKAIYECEMYYNRGCDIIFDGVDFGINKEDYRQWHIIAIELSTDIVEFPEDSANGFYNRITNGEKFQDVANAYGYEYMEGNVGKGTLDNNEFENFCIGLSTGESGIIEIDGIYCVVQCISDYDEEATDVAYEDELTKQKSNKLLEFYDEYTKDMTITVDDAVWSTINFSTAIFTKDDYEEIVNNLNSELSTTN